MRASASVSSVSRPWARAAPLLAVAYLASHLPLLAPSLEDIDSINFALGLHDFDLVAHQPHPPGYPVFIALGRVSAAVIAATAPALPSARADALALAIWSALAGAIAVLAAVRVFGAVSRDGEPSAAVWASALLMAAPLFWMTGLRPMSDLTGLAAVLVSQALALESPSRPSRLTWSALVAGLAAGVRVQTVLLTLPLLLWAAAQQARPRGAWWLVSRPAAALAAGGLAWAVPLLVTAGGVRAYLAALGAQAGEDFAWVDMLWLNPTARQLAFALENTFALPWAVPGLAGAVGLVALAGAGWLLVRDRRALWLVAIGYVPYAVFHLLLQETPHVRYALPLVPAAAYLTARGAGMLGRVGPVVMAGLVAVSLWVAVPAGLAYGREGHPAFRAIDAITEAAAGASQRPMIFQHFSLRRPLQAAPPPGTDVVEPRRIVEWLGPVEYWRAGGRAPVWFLADPRRTDLALIDPRGAPSVTRYTWAVADRPELGGSRPTGASWYRFDRPPGWFVGEGWALTPEAAGVSRASGLGLHRRPLDAYLRRGAGPFRVLVGGRLTDGAPATVRIQATLDGAPIDEWLFEPAAPSDAFLRVIELPTGVPAGHGAYATVRLTAASARGGSMPVVAIEQFDAQSSDTLLWGFGDGWHEAELDQARALSWRWTSERSVLRVWPRRSFVLRLRGESPLRYLDAAPRVRLVSGGRTLAQFSPRSDFDWRVPVHADDVVSGAVAIEVSPVYLPGPAEGTSDARRLGLRLFEVALEAVDAGQR